MSQSNLFILCVAIVAFLCFGPSLPTLQKPSVKVTSDSVSSTMVTTDYFGNKTTCTTYVMPGGNIVGGCN